jgi:hypothetical protein
MPEIVNNCNDNISRVKTAKNQFQEEKIRERLQELETKNHELKRMLSIVASNPKEYAQKLLINRPVFERKIEQPR